MPEVLYRNRRAHQIANAHLRVTVLAEGGHIAAIQHIPTGINPLWTPPWPSIEPSTFHPAAETRYGDDAESKLLAGIMGHNLCLDIFGPPSPEEAAAGMTVHGESSVAPYRLESSESHITQWAELIQPQLGFERTIQLAEDVLVIRETVENLTAMDRAIAWTQHVTLGPPFLECGRTRFHAPATRSKVFATGAEFDWPGAPDLSVFSNETPSANYTTHLMDPTRDQAFVLAWNPNSRLLLGYIWNRTDFPWLGRWEENESRTQAPWNGETKALGLEFGASPFPETRRQMIERGSLFQTPAYRWIPARSRLTVDYCAFLRPAAAMPQNVTWDGWQLTVS